MAILAVLLGLASVFATPLDDLKAAKQLPMPVYNWATPDGANPDEVVELGRITGSVGVMAEAAKEAIQSAVTAAGKAQAKRVSGSKPVVLSVVLRPWFRSAGSITDPASVAAWNELAVTAGQLAVVRDAIAAATFKPAIVALIDAETFDCRTDPKRTQCALIYAVYDVMVRGLGCSAVEWYSMGQIPSPADPDEFAFQHWSVPFAGLQSVGFEIYYTGESKLRRDCGKRARTHAKSLNVGKTTAWIAAPGSGRVFHWGTGSDYSGWTWNTGEETHYDRQLGRELFVPWYRSRPDRYSDPVDAVCTYPNPLDLRLVDPERKHLLSWIKGGTE